MTSPEREEGKDRASGSGATPGQPYGNREAQPERKKIRFSVVIPVHNEEESVHELHTEISAAMRSLGTDYEVIFVDDGSFDATPRVLRAIALRDDRVSVIRFAAHFGKAAAYMAAFEAARGDELVITLDGDLQDDPAEIPCLIAKLREGYDLVAGWKQGRFDNEPLKAFASKVFNTLTSLLFRVNLHDSNSGFRVMRTLVAKSLGLHGDQYRFIPELASAKGFAVTEVAVKHRKRKHGKSKYGVTRFWTGMLDLLTVRFITAYQHRPLHFIGTAGLIPLVLGLGLEIYVLMCKLAGDTFQSHVAALIIGVMLIIMGFQSVLTGLIGEMLSTQSKSKPYVIERSDG